MRAASPSLNIGQTFSGAAELQTSVTVSHLLFSLCSGTEGEVSSAHADHTFPLGAAEFKKQLQLYSTVHTTPNTNTPTQGWNSAVINSFPPHCKQTYVLLF